MDYEIFWNVGYTNYEFPDATLRFGKILEAFIELKMIQSENKKTRVLRGPHYVTAALWVI